MPAQGDVPAQDRPLPSNDICMSQTLASLGVLSNRSDAIDFEFGRGDNAGPPDADFDNPRPPVSGRLHLASDAFAGSAVTSRGASQQRLS